jgi:hypothetical protein
LDLLFPFHTFASFRWPASFYFILENDAEMSFIEVSFNALSKALQAPTPIDSEVFAWVPTHGWRLPAVRFANQATL